jgi:hypothetical protein
MTGMVARLRAWMVHSPAGPVLAFALLVLATRFLHIRRMLLDGLPYFADADCYTRMFRVRQMLDHGAFFQARHGWENFPDGITPHTTAPLDWVIGIIALPLAQTSSHGLDWAGWMVPPLLAAIGGFVLWRLLARLDLGWIRIPILLTYAFHPLLIWANAVGRPDHQALTVPLLSVLLVLEWIRKKEDRFHAVTGVLWGLALWISLYEPLILLTLTLLVQAFTLRPNPTTTASDRWTPWWAGLLGVFLTTWLAEGIRIPSLPLPDSPEMAHWLSMIGELKSPPWSHWTLLGWAAPIAVVVGIRHRRTALAGLTLPLVWALAVLALGIFQQRWLVFMVIPFSIAVFLALQPLKSRAARTLSMVLHLLPLMAWNAYESAHLQPPRELADIRKMAASISGEGSVLAPWWLSPAILYYSGQPIVASSSHQSFPGTLDSARFFTTSDFVLADEIVARRNVGWVAVYDPVRAFTNARQILYGPEADLTIEQREVHRIVCLRLWDFKSVPTRYRLAYASKDWKLYRFAADRNF